jgi:hypothetical protein
MGKRIVMKTKLKLFILLFFCWQTLCAQSIYKATEQYFRHDPFKTEFSQFLNKLINDPSLSQKEVIKTTDSTLFFLQGMYATHSPFFFPSISCKVVLAERLEYPDSLSNTPLRFFIYQLIGYAPPGEDGRKDVKKEFEKLNNRLKKGLQLAAEKDLSHSSGKSGMITNYTYGGMIFSPLTIAWTSSADKKENMVVLTIRFFMTNNRAYLPETFNGPQTYID